MDISQDIEISMEDVIDYFDESIFINRADHDEWNLLARLVVQQMMCETSSEDQ